MSAEDSPKKAPEIRTILFPTDFSETAYAALPWVQWMAREGGTNIHVLHVVTPVPVSAELAGYYSGGSFQTAQFVEAAEARLSAEEQFFEGMWKPCHVEARVGDPGQTIDDYAREIDADIIVMSTHQPGWIERMFLGSVAEETLRDAPCPVLVVPAT